MKVLKPKKQGNLDGACGFYSVANAVDLLTEIDPDVTFRCLIESMLQDKDPMCFIDGMERGTLKDIISRTFKKLNSDELELVDEDTGESYVPSLKCNIPYWQTEPSNRDDFVSLMTEVDMNKTGAVAIIGYDYRPDENGAEYSHWTVVKKVTEKNLITFDSGDERKLIPWDKVRVSSRSDDKKYNTKRPYFIFPKDVFLITNQSG